MIDNAIAGPSRLRRARSRTLVVGLPLLAMAMFGSAALVYWQPVHAQWQWVFYVLAALSCLLLIRPTQLAIRQQRRERLEKIGLALMALLSLTVLMRIASLLFEVAVKDPDLGLFRPTFAFLPGLYLGAMLLLPSRRALAIGWGVWLTVLVLLALAMLLNGWTLAREGIPELGIWLLAGNPLFLLALHALPGLEEALNRSAEEIGELRERTRLMDLISASEERFNLVVDSLQVGVWDLRFEPGQPVQRWWSPRFYALLGYTPEQLPPSAGNAARLTGEATEAIRNALILQLRTAGVTAMDVSLLTRDQGWRWFNLACKAELNAEGRFTRVTGAIEDIHQRRMAEIELREAQAELIALAYRDALTGLPNRRAFDEQLQREWDRARRNGKPLSLLALDIDWFKRYNDRYGHPAGDACLRRVAKVIGQCVRRPGDFAARVGGEEFHVLMPETEAAGAMKVAQLIETTLRGLALSHADSPLAVVTCSIGSATVTPVSVGPADPLLEQADHNLYQSKRAGRGRVTG